MSRVYQSNGENDRLRNYPYEVQERAAIYEYEGRMTRQEAEERAVREYDRTNGQGKQG